MRINSLVIRILDRVPRFARTTVPPTDLQIERSIIGIYDSGEPEERIVVTDAGIHVRVDHQWRDVRFSDIAQVKADADKTQGNRIQLKLMSGEMLQIYASGHTGRFRDVYEISRFLDRAATASRSPASKLPMS